MKTLKIKDICDKGSSSLKQKDVENQNGKYPVFGASGLIGKIDTYHQNKEYIAIVKDGSGIGRVSFMPAFSSVIGTLQYILPKKGYNIKYISYCLQSLDLANYKQGAAIPHIYFRDYGEYEVNVEENPDEQQRIVTYLDAEFAKIEALKANAEKQLQAAKDLFQAALKELLTPKEGWVEKKFGDVCSIRGEYGLNESATDYNGVRYLRITDITDDGELNSDKVSAKNDSNKNQESLEVGDILFARTGATVGKTLIYRKEFGKCVFAGYLIRYRTNPNIILPQYLFYYTHSTKYYEWVKNNQAAAAQPNISAQKYNGLVIDFPQNMAEQQQIANKLDAISAKVKALQTNYTETITLCNDLKQALLKKVFE